MGLYPGGVQIIAGTVAGLGNGPHDAYIPGADPAVTGPAATASALAAPAGPSPR